MTEDAPAAPAAEIEIFEGEDAVKELTAALKVAAVYADKFHVAVAAHVVRVTMSEDSPEGAQRRFAFVMPRASATSLARVLNELLQNTDGA